MVNDETDMSNINCLSYVLSAWKPVQTKTTVPVSLDDSNLDGAVSHISNSFSNSLNLSVVQTNDSNKKLFVKYEIPKKILRIFLLFYST